MCCLLLQVSHLHACGIIHRDIKPENLLVDKKGVVKIVDFNICVELETNAAGEEEAVECWHGTPAFTPPECLQPDQKRVAGRPLDMWSLGVTLFATVVGQLPFSAELLPELFENIRTESVVFPSNLTLSDDLKDLVAGLMTKDPLERLTMTQVKQHPWLMTYPLSRTRSELKRSQVGFSQRCLWSSPEDDAGSESSASGTAISQCRRGSVHDMDEEVKKLSVHGYEFL